jgi:hypothetical protein
MRRRIKTVRLLAPALSLVMALALPGAVVAQSPSKAECANAGLKSCKALEEFTAKLRAAVQGNDKNAVAALVAYPINVQFAVKGKDDLDIPDKDALVRNYDTIVTKGFREVISVPSFINARGIIKFPSESAEVWVTVEKGRPLIDAIIISE